MMRQTIIQEAVLMLYIIKYSSTVPVHAICTLSVSLCFCCISSISFSAFFFLKLSSSKPCYLFFFLFKFWN